MAFLNETINTADLPESTGFDPIPAGTYTATITEAGLQDTKAGTGQYIKVRYDITGPTHQGRVVYGNLNIRNPNPKAEEIGRQQLGDLMRAIGLSSVNDTDQLVGGSCQIKVVISPARTDEKTGTAYDASNEVKGWKAVSGSVAPAPVATSSQPKPAANAAPWAK
jgi:hypothetical protein